MRLVGTLRDALTREAAAPSTAPLLPERGKDFLEGLIQPVDYLKVKRDQALAQALREVDTRSVSRPPRASIVVLGLVATLNLGLAVGSFVDGDLAIGFLAALTVLMLVGLVVALTYRRP